MSYTKTRGWVTSESLGKKTNIAKKIAIEVIVKAGVVPCCQKYLDSASSCEITRTEK
jgi:hypothetical protein